MKILLLGDYSNVHATLAEGLRALGHFVVVASDGDGWKDYPRDIDLKRNGTPGAKTIRQRLLDAAYLLRLHWLFAVKFRGFDVVQIINPVFLPLRAERIMPFYRKLRRHNRSVFMAAYGMDHYWVKAGLDCTTFRYSDFNFGGTIRSELPENSIFVRDWLNGSKGHLNRAIAADCDGIPAGLYEYWASYRRYLSDADRPKLTYIPFPIRIDERPQKSAPMPTDRPLRIFIGIQRSRSAYKGTDIMWRALQRVKEQFPHLVDIHKAESVPFDEYKRLLDTSDVILDQLYSYTPAMNALQAMSQGLIVVGGAEQEYYQLQEQSSQLQGTDLPSTPQAQEPQNTDDASRPAIASPERPIINVHPTEDDVVEKLTWLIQHRELIPVLQESSRIFVRQHHDHVKVASQYLHFYQLRMKR